MNRSLTRIACALVLQISVFAAQVPVSLEAQAPQQPAQAPVPDAPAPQAPAPMSDVKSQITPGIGSQETRQPAAASPNASSGDQPSDAAPAHSPSRPPAASVPDTVQGEPPVAASINDIKTVIVSNTNAVEVPVTVKDRDRKSVV